MACTTNYRKTKSKWETDDGFGPGDRVRPGWILREVKCVRHLCAGELASAYFRHFVCMWGLKGSDIGLRTGTLAVRESARVFVCVCVCACVARPRVRMRVRVHGPAYTHTHGCTGGTYFDLVAQTVHCPQGYLLTFDSKLFHQGQPITSGARYLLVGFCHTDPSQGTEPGNVSTADLSLIL